MNLYQQQILDHYKNPQNFGELSDFDLVHAEFNPSCGDKVVMTLKFDGEILKDINFSGEGCAISVAASSMLTEAVKGKSKKEISQITKEDILEMLGVQVNPGRLKCALLGLTSLKEVLKKS